MLLLHAIPTYIIVSYILIKSKPRCMFEANGSPIKFGLGPSQTLMPFWLFSLLISLCPTEGCDGCEWCCGRPFQELPDHFQSMYREEILNLYLSMKEQCESCGYPLLQNVTLDAFEDFVVANSRMYK
eukprot:jgi/Mesvir1/22287/Mv17046-RA.1